jgi:ethanolamine utilization protein EutM
MNRTMAQQAIGLIETRGLVALVEGTDAMLKAANVELAGPMTQVGNALVTAVVVGDVAAVKAATDAGAQAIKAIKANWSACTSSPVRTRTWTVLPKKK